MNQYLSLLLIFVASPLLTGKPLELEDGTHVIKITEVAKHPDVRVPTDGIPDGEYKKVEGEEDLRLVLSRKGKKVVIEPRGVSGVRTRAGASGWEFQLTKGLFAGGVLTLTQTKEGIVATMTEFGSGVPVIESRRGQVQAAKR